MRTTRASFRPPPPPARSPPRLSVPRSIQTPRARDPVHRKRCVDRRTTTTPCEACACDITARVTPRQSSRPPRAIGAGRVSHASANRAAPSSPSRRRRPRLVAHRSSHLYRRIARARVVTVALIPRVVTECRDRVEARGTGRGGDSLTGHDSSYTRRSTARSNHSDRPARSNHATRESVTRARATRASIDATRYRASSARRSRTSSRDSIARASRGRHRRRRSVSVRPNALE